MVKASAPGKCILFGEHAVVYGQPALACSIDQRMTIEIESETGFNAEIRARLCIDRITDELNLPEVQDKIVSVVDCVGKI